MWNPSQVGTILGSYYWGYCFSMLPGSLIAQKFGHYNVILSSCAINAIVSIIFPVLVDKGGFICAVLARLIIGVASGPLMPSIQASTATKLI